MSEREERPARQRRGQVPKETGYSVPMTLNQRLIYLAVSDRIVDDFVQSAEQIAHATDFPGAPEIQRMMHFATAYHTGGFDAAFQTIIALDEKLMANEHPMVKIGVPHVNVDPTDSTKWTVTPGGERYKEIAGVFLGIIEAERTVGGGKPIFTGIAVIEHGNLREIEDPTKNVAVLVTVMPGRDTPIVHVDPRHLVNKDTSPEGLIEQLYPPQRKEP